MLNRSKSTTLRRSLHHCSINRFSGFSSCYYFTIYTLLHERASIIQHGQPLVLRSVLAHERSGRFKTNTGILTGHPSPTPFGLGLGADLPVADEPPDGILGHTAVGILTQLVRYSCRHSHFLPLHPVLQLNFTATRTLPYHLLLRANL